MTFRYGLLKNSEPIPMALPYPLAGVLAAGESIVTRYTPGRLAYLLNCGALPGAREMLVTESSGVPLESAVSAKSPPRDYYKGTVKTVGATTPDIVWALPPNSGDGTKIPASGMLPGAYSGYLTVLGVEATGYSAFRRLVNFQILADGTLDSANASTSTVGTDKEVDAATALTITYSASGVTVTPTGVALKTYTWTATLDVSMVLGS